MGIINILDQQTANMIAAGEVVKELLENAIDAGATSIALELMSGGRAYIRVTDNGCGFLREDIPKALLRHATSKLSNGGAELEAIQTLGFRGEALAAISAVSRLEIISKHRSEQLGTRLTSDENGIVMVDTGCPDGTSILVRDLFYNQPARQRFLKRDATEGAAAVTVAERAALSHPEISFTVVSDGERKFFTDGSGRLFQAVYAVFGRAFAQGLRPVDYAFEGVRVSGYICSPDQARGSRAMQVFYVNGRYVRSKTIMAAAEEAYRSYLPHGRFPAAILFVTLPAGLTDVNVHPAKLEIKFASEKKIFEAVYYAVRNVLCDTASAPAAAAETSSADAPAPEQRPAHAAAKTPAEQEAMPEYAAGRQAAKLWPAPAARQNERPPYRPAGPVRGYEVFVPDLGTEDLPANHAATSGMVALRSPDAEAAQEQLFAGGQTAIDRAPKRPWRLLGEAYDAYIFVEFPEHVWIVDKHAAHERVLYEQLTDRKTVMAQELLEPLAVSLTNAQAETLLAHAEYLEGFGFRLEDFGGGSVLLRAVPSALADTRELPAVLEEFAAALSVGNALPFEQTCDRALFTMACKAAMKAGQKNDPAHDEWLVERLVENESIRFCPHGRPVLKEFSKREIEKFFDR